MKAYKVWIDIEECEVDEDGGVLSSDMLDCLDFGSSGTFDTLEEAKAFARRMEERA